MEFMKFVEECQEIRSTSLIILFNVKRLYQPSCTTPKRTRGVRGPAGKRPEKDKEKKKAKYSPGEVDTQPPLGKNRKIAAIDLPPAQNVLESPQSLHTSRYRWKCTSI